MYVMRWRVLGRVTVIAIIIIIIVIMCSRAEQVEADAWLGGFHNCPRLEGRGHY